jgi:hypothetical protein
MIKHSKSKHHENRKMMASAEGIYEFLFLRPL